jgi:hypothetical protein
MSLRDKIRRKGTSGSNFQKSLFKNFGVLENPFPSAGQTFGHPHLETDIDKKIIPEIQEFEYSHKTQVLVVEGTQGVGKTNLLNYYQIELRELYQEDKTFYIIRYYPDPEPSFDAIIRRVFQEIGENHIRKMAQKLGGLNRDERSSVIDEAKNYEVRLVLHALSKSAEDGDGEFDSSLEAAMEWVTGLRVLNKHRDLLGVRFRLDTVESKTQALRDIVYISVELQILGGIFLLLDELEKQDYSLSTTPVLRYLSAIRALIDALPTHLFLMMALTPDARRRYFTMLPAIAGRLQNVYSLSPLEDEKLAFSLYKRYLLEAQKRAETDPNGGALRVKPDIFNKEEISRIFKDLSEISEQKGIPGVTHRDFLNELHLKTQDLFKSLQAS